MTIAEAEALLHLAEYHFRIAGHGEHLTMRLWRDDAMLRLLMEELNLRNTQRFEQIEARAP